MKKKYFIILISTEYILINNSKMKINFKFIKCVILLFMISNICENLGTMCSKLQTSASFKSNYKLMLTKKKSERREQGNDNGAEANNTTAANTSSSTSNTYSLSANGSNSSSNTVANGFITKERKVLVPDVPILFQGWAKYFYYIDKGNSKPSNFFLNDDYDHQTLEEKDSVTKDKVINTYKN